jgi:integrase
VTRSKTDAGVRVVDLLPVLRDELLSYRARTMMDQDTLVFATTAETAHSFTNVHRRMLAPAVKNANARLLKDGKPPLPEGLTPHSLRRTFASILFALPESTPPT